MTTLVPVQSLWRGLIHRRRTLAELAAARGDDLSALRSRSRLVDSRPRAAFALAAVAEGHAATDVARFIHRSAWQVRSYGRAARACG